jgi:heme/copper-type cytochrome/quinol oxidase subunit 2
MTTWLNLTIKDRASPIIEQLIYFHDYALIIILMIITTVFYTIVRIIQNKQTRRFILEGQIIETIWTIVPAIILVFIAIPSLRLLYLIDEIHNPILTLKAVAKFKAWKAVLAFWSEILYLYRKSADQNKPQLNDNRQVKKSVGNLAERHFRCGSLCSCERLLNGYLMTADLGPLAAAEGDRIVKPDD